MDSNYIALFGEWNTTNIGDRAIGYHASQYLLSFGFGVKLFALGSFQHVGNITRIEELEEIFSSTAPQKFDYDRERTLRIKKILHRYFPRFKFIFRFYRNFGGRKNVSKELSFCQAVVVGGGALLDDDDLHFPSSLLLVKLLSKQLGLPLFCLGCSSAGKFSWLGRLILRDFLNYCDLTAVRDSPSKQVLQPLTRKEIYIFGDFALKTQVQIRPIYPVKKIGLNVMLFAGNDRPHQHVYEFFLERLMATLLQTTEYAVTLFTTGDFHDYAVASKINSKCGNSKQVFHPNSFLDLANFLKENDVVLCSRLHAAIIALSEDIPAIALWVKPKIKNFFHTIGLHEFCIQAVPQDGINEIIKETIDMKLTQYFKYVNFGYFAVGRQKAFVALSELSRNRASFTPQP